MTRNSFIALTVLILLFTAGCMKTPTSCPPQSYADLSLVSSFASDEYIPIQFPLEEVNSDTTDSFTLFCTGSRGSATKRAYHAAEDYFHPAGTPVYAIGDGEVSFSGPMGGYGWLVIIDHPQWNLYSLYGHLSPSQWRIDKGTVSKGELIAYLGESHENGGSKKNPLEPHLHLGIRVGQRLDYPGKGEWRWMAGWIKSCPTDLGWLRPSIIISEQTFQEGGFDVPKGYILEKWGVEILFAIIYLCGTLGSLIYGIKKNNYTSLFLAGAVMFAAGYFFYRDGWRMPPVLFVMSAVLLSAGLNILLKRSRSDPSS